MFPHLTQFALNAVVVAVVLLLHLVVVQMLLRAISGRRRAFGKWVRIGIAAGVVFLDLPLIYLQLVYKSYHPLILDQILYLIWLPWALLQFNLLLFSVGFLGYRYGVRPLMRGRRDRRRKGGMEKKNASSSPGRNDAEGVLAAAPKLTQMNSMESNTMSRPIMDDGPDSADPKKEGAVYHRRRFLQTSALALGGVALNGSLLMAANGREEHTIERIVVAIPNLPVELKGMTIAMISDIHSSLFMTRKTMEYYAKIVKSLRADLIVVPGDFVNSRLSEVYPFAEAFSGLSAPLGVYGVTGNHDYYTREIEAVAKEVEQAGIRLLRNENVRIEKNGVGFRLLGMDDNVVYDVREYVRDGKTKEGRIENLLKGVDAAEPTIFLCHKPYPFEDYAQLGIDLTLSGHTHGGQIVLGKLDRMNVSMASLASTYIAGLYKAHSNPESQMYVSRGVGTVGLPIRINCPPEVTHITIV